MGIVFDGLVDSILLRFLQLFGICMALQSHRMWGWGKVGKYIHSRGGNACMGVAGIWGKEGVAAWERL